MPRRSVRHGEPVSAVNARASAGGILRRLVDDCHLAVFSCDDQGACGLGGAVWVDGDARLGCAVGAPGVDVVAESFGEARSVRAVPGGAHAELRLWCLEALGGEVGDGVAFG